MAGSGLNVLELLEQRAMTATMIGIGIGILIFKLIFPGKPDHIILVHDDINTLVAAKAIVLNDLKNKYPGKTFALSFPTTCEMHSIKQLPTPKNAKNVWETRAFTIAGECRIQDPGVKIGQNIQKVWKMTMTFTHPFPGKDNNLKRVAYFKQVKEEFDAENPGELSGEWRTAFIRDALSPRSCWTHSPIEYSDYVKPQPKVPKAPGPRKSWKDTKVEVPAV